MFINHPLAGKCILVNYDDDVYRQNFTIAHELGHAIFDFEDNINISFNKWDKKDLLEIRANSFASNFLIPKEALLKRANFQWNKSIIINLAKQLKVNPITLLISLRESNLINNSLYEELKGIKIPQPEKIDSELQNLSEKRLIEKTELLKKGLSQFYVNKCYEAYEKGFITAQRLAEMNLVNENGLRDILDNFNLKLNNEY